MLVDSEERTAKLDDFRFLLELASVVVSDGVVSVGKRVWRR